VIKILTAIESLTKISGVKPQLWEGNVGVPVLLQIPLANREMTKW
jgi:hypothetical protein